MIKITLNTELPVLVPEKVYARVKAAYPDEELQVLLGPLGEGAPDVIELTGKLARHAPVHEPWIRLVIHEVAEETAPNAEGPQL